AFTGETVIATDIAVDPRWAPYQEGRDLALAAGLRACWSTPIRAASGAVLGTFAIYYTEPSPPRASDLRLVEMATHIAGIAIEKPQAARALAERAERLADASRRKDEFLALLAHELRNPLAPIITSVERLGAHEGDPEVVAHCRGVIERQARQLVRL